MVVGRVLLGRSGRAAARRVLLCLQIVRALASDAAVVVMLSLPLPLALGLLPVRPFFRSSSAQLLLGPHGGSIDTRPRLRSYWSCGCLVCVGFLAVTLLLPRPPLGQWPGVC